MAINFPDSPATNDSFTSGGKKWIFNGTVWSLVTANSYTIPTGEVTTAKILDANVTAAKLASGAAVTNIGYTPANIAGPTFTGTVVLPSTTSIGTVSSTEIGYVDGVTSAIQTQLDSKLTATTAPTSNKNAIINGAMNVWQRGTSVANGGGKSYSPDRWWCSRGGAVGGMTVSRQTSTQTGFSYSARVQRDSGNTSTQLIVFYQDFETINSIRFAGGNVSLSFYAKLGANYSSASSVLGYTITYGTGTDQSYYSGMTGQANAAGSTVTLTSTFQRFTVTAAIPSSATQISIGFFYTPVGTASTNDWFEITGVQLEAGAVATPFEFEDYGTTLTKCQRYYQKAYNDTTYAGNSGVAVGGFWTYAYAAIPNGIIYYSFLFPTRMRVTPTVYIYSYEGQQNRVHASGVGEMGANTAVPAQIGNASCAVINNSGSTMPSGYLYLGFYVASAEL
jgi:hypothetical protein